MQDSTNVLKQQIQLALSMLYCPAKNKAQFFCVSDKCKKGLSPLVCKTDGCQSCQGLNQANNEHHCKKQKLILIQHFLEKILKKRQKMRNEQTKIIENSLKYFDAIIQFLSQYRQNFENLVNSYGFSPNQFNLIQAVKSGNFQYLNHQLVRNIRKQTNSISYFGFLDISETILNQIFFDIQNSFSYYYNTGLANSYVKVPYNQSHQYKFKDDVTDNILSKLDRDTVKLSFESEITETQFQIVITNFQKLKSLSIMHSNLVDIKNIYKLSNLKNLNQLLIQSDKRLESGLNQKSMQQILKNKNLKKVAYKQDFSKSLQQISYDTHFSCRVNNRITSNSLFSIYPLSSQKKLNNLQYWEQNSFNLKHNSVENQNLKYLCIFARKNDNFNVRNNLYKKIPCYANLLVLKLQGLYFEESPGKLWGSMKKLKKLSLCNCQNVTQSILDDISLNAQIITQLQIVTSNFKQKQVSFQFLINLKQLNALSLMIYSQIHDTLITINLNALAQIKSLRYLNLIDYQGFNENWMDVLKNINWLEHLLISVKNEIILQKIKQFKNFDNLQTLVLEGNIKRQAYLPFWLVMNVCNFKKLKNLSINIPIRAGEIKIITKVCQNLQSLAINNVPQQKQIKKINYYQRSFLNFENQQTKKNYRNILSQCNIHRLKKLKLVRVAYELNQSTQLYLKGRNIQLVTKKFTQYDYPLKQSQIQRLERQERKKQHKVRQEQQQRLRIYQQRQRERQELIKKNNLARIQTRYGRR